MYITSLAVNLYKSSALVERDFCGILHTTHEYLRLIIMQATIVANVSIESFYCCYYIGEIEE